MLTRIDTINTMQSDLSCYKNIFALNSPKIIKKSQTQIILNDVTNLHPSQQVCMISNSQYVIFLILNFIFMKKILYVYSVVPLQINTQTFQGHGTETPIVNSHASFSPLVIFEIPSFSRLWFT